MTNQLVGDVFLKIIEEVVAASSTAFEENGVPSSTLEEFQQAWQSKLSARNVATMPWDPKPQPVVSPPQAAAPTPVPNGLPSQPAPTYSYDHSSPVPQNSGPRIKAEPGTEHHYGGLPAQYSPNAIPAQGGLARAQQLVQKSFGPAANASLNAMQQRGGLALPGQQVKQQPGLHLPPGAQSNAAAQFQQQQARAMQHRQQQVAQQTQPRIKMENNSPQMSQAGFDPQQQLPAYSQTDGADDALGEWRAQLALRRAATAEQTHEADQMMRDRIQALSEDMQSGLMVPLDEQPSRNKKHRRSKGKAACPQADSSATAGPSIPQLDGVDEDIKPEIKEEDDDNAINSDLDDSDDDGPGNMDDDDDDLGDTILCTYDKVQRVKNKWKCTLKDGVMSVNGRNWVFHKGSGEFEW